MVVRGIFMQGEKLVLAAVGDCQIATRHSTCRDKTFLDAIKIIREADAAYANLEMGIHDYEGYPSYKGLTHGGTYTRGPPYCTDEMKWMGFGMVSLANNHTMDYMDGGLLATVRNCERAGLVCAGAGKDLAEARAPAYLETAQGRLALISVETQLQQHWRAGDARRDSVGRPGNNPLYASKVYTLPPEDFKALRQVAEGLKPFRVGSRAPIPQDAKEIDLGVETTSGERIKFIIGDKFDVTSVARKEDVEGNLRAIEDARGRADWVFVAHHNHCEDSIDETVPPKFAQPFARACIDAGADAYLGTGAHQLRGIEIYNEKPIFYGLADFISQRDLTTKLPQDFYDWVGLGHEALPYEAFVARAKNIYHTIGTGGETLRGPTTEGTIAVCTYKRHTLTELKLYPVDIYGVWPHQHGRPKLADAKLAEQIISRWQKCSEPFDTKIDSVKGVGVVRLS